LKFLGPHLNGAKLRNFWDSMSAEDDELASPTNHKPVNSMRSEQNDVIKEEESHVAEPTSH
jgi:hypothetical protein